MATLFNDYLKVLPAIEIIFLMLRIVLLFFGKKNAEVLVKLKDEKLKIFIDSRTMMVKLFKLLLWLSPLYLVFFPIGIYIFMPEINAIMVFTVLFLMELLLLVEFLYSRWLLRYLKAHRPNPA